MIQDSFKQYVAEVVAKHFVDVPAPDGTTETNKRHIDLRDAACRQMREHINSLTSDENERSELLSYAEKEAQSAIYSLFPKIARKPKRYK